ncbi:hypothetical protein [Herbaspirillum huttiense]|uniref:Uncharacterized protein n=1 Tax=Herbaspirillum huttiense subsp. lycopersici TaxID=3074428 RepID=A0ABU2EGS1_9BURK|nr:hypothetical protein [Herbaspirillum huttiense]MDR9847083.1 hypothetical protein [Herbaspirillum huttiense SE1]
MNLYAPRGMPALNPGDVLYLRWALKSNGGGVRRSSASEASVQRLLKRGFIQRKPNDRSSWELMIATKQGAAWLNLLDGKLKKASRELPAEFECDMEPVSGDILPAVGTKVLIHLARADKWVEHTVVGYYVHQALSHQVKGKVEDAHVWRVFVRVRDKEGFLNARLLSDIRPVGWKEPVPEPVDPNRPLPVGTLKCPDDDADLHFEVMGMIRIARYSKVYPGMRVYSSRCPQCGKYHDIEAPKEVA